MKRYVCLVLTLILCLSASPLAFAENVLPAADIIGSFNAIADSPTRAEETTWYFRVVNGRTQMRLWSITYGKWLTEWIDIGPAP